MSFSDPTYVRRQYATEEGLLARKAIYSETSGPDARDVVFAAIAEAHPDDVLEVGCGEGELAQRLAHELGATVIAMDQSERMVALALERGVDAQIGDAQELPFGDASFDVVVAAWMLYHVPDLDRALAEMRRVLRPGGRLVVSTNYNDHLAEMLDLAGVERWSMSFSGENGEEILGRVFARVERRHAEGTVTIHGANAIRAYLASSEGFRPYADRVPELDGPLVARRRPTVFVATK